MIFMAVVMIGGVIWLAGPNGISLRRYIGHGMVILVLGVLGWGLKGPAAAVVTGLMMLTILHAVVKK